MKAEEDCDEVEAGPEEDEIHVTTVVVVAKEGDVNEAITHVGDDVTGNHLRVPALTQIDPSVTQSSPSTPAELRKNNVRRNRSFSPVR